MPGFIALVAVVMIFSIPLVAIWTSFQIKAKKMELEGGDSGSLRDLKRQIGNLMNENELLRERLKALEQIVSEFPQISTKDRDQLRINIEQNEMSIEEIEKQRATDKKNKLI